MVLWFQSCVARKSLMTSAAVQAPTVGPKLTSQQRRIVAACNRQAPTVAKKIARALGKSEVSSYLLATMPGLAATLGSTLGRTVLVPGAAVLEVTGIVVSRRIVRTVLD